MENRENLLNPKAAFKITQDLSRETTEENVTKGKR